MNDGAAMDRFVEAFLGLELGALIGEGVPRLVEIFGSLRHLVAT